MLNVQSGPKVGIQYMVYNYCNKYYTPTFGPLCISLPVSLKYVLWFFNVTFRKTLPLRGPHCPLHSMYVMNDNISVYSLRCSLCTVSTAVNYSPFSTIQIITQPQLYKMSTETLCTKHYSPFQCAVSEHIIRTATGFGNCTNKCDRFKYIRLIYVVKVKVSMQHAVKVQSGSTGMGVLIINIGVAYG